jgi:hypothetical protein
MTTSFGRDLDHLDACGFGSAHHVSGPAPAVEGDHELRLSFIDHPLIAQRPSGFAVRVPVSLKRRMLAS